MSNIKKDFLKRLIAKFDTERKELDGTPLTSSKYDLDEEGRSLRHLGAPKITKGETHKAGTPQPPSQKTIFVDKNNLLNISGWFQNKDVDVSFVPGGKNKGKIVLNKKYGPRKAGSTVENITYSGKPAKGKYPVEIFSSHSPLGSSGRPVITKDGEVGGIHFGDKIIKVKEFDKKEGGRIERNPYNYQSKVI